MEFILNILKESTIKTYSKNAFGQCRRHYIVYNAISSCNFRTNVKYELYKVFKWIKQTLTIIISQSSSLSKSEKDLILHHYNLG